MGIRISEMEEATTFGADDYVPIVTNGTNKKALGAKIKDFIAGFFATKTGDNISDKATFRSAIEISATNTPFDKTGTGMSAENVQAAIAELSGNRALIDGSNIANPSAFRSAIEAQKNISSNTATVTLSTTKYGTFYYADTTPTVATSRIISIVVTSSGGNNFAQCIMTASGVIRVFGDYSGGSVTIKYFYV